MTVGNRLATTLAGAAMFAAAAHADPVTPDFDSFGALPAATFGGSGIPNNAVAVSTFTVGGDTITLGLTAHQRFFNPPLTNDGAGTFKAGTGSNFGNPATPGGPGPSGFLGSTWNVAYYVNVSGGGNFADYDVDLFYDLENGAGTDFADLGRIDIDALFGGSATLAQDSQNMLFTYLTTGFPGIAFPPASPSYDPNAPGEFSFLLRVTEKGESDSLGDVAINVEVPEPASMTLLLAGAAGLGFGLRRRKRQA